MTVHQDATPAVLVHLADAQGIAICEDLVPVNPYTLPAGVLSQPCPLCHAIVQKRVVSMATHDQAVQAAYDEGYSDGSDY